MKCRIKLIIIDVDGTLTDAGIYYDEHGNELKKFCTKDAAGFFAARNLSIKTMILTGRECAATTRRMEELHADYVYQNIKNKVKFIKQFIEENHLLKDEICYIGDDLNDLAPMRFAGYIGCPKNSCKEVLEIADYVSQFNGGHGAVRDVIEHILRASGDWEKAVKSVYGIGI